MSTNYGLLCLTCDESLVQENLSEFGANLALRNAAALANFHTAYMAIYDLVFLHTDWTQNMDGLIHWLHEHQGHSLTLTNEYGDYWNGTQWEKARKHETRPTT